MIAAATLNGATFVPTVIALGLLLYCALSQGPRRPA